MGSINTDYLTRNYDGNRNHYLLFGLICTAFAIATIAGAVANHAHLQQMKAAHSKFSSWDPKSTAYTSKINKLTSQTRENAIFGSVVSILACICLAAAAYNHYMYRQTHPTHKQKLISGIKEPNDSDVQDDKSPANI